MSDPNQTLQQYTRGFGHPPLIGALSRLYTKLLNRPTDINPNTEVLVTVINLVILLTYLLTRIVLFEIDWRRRRLWNMDLINYQLAVTIIQIRWEGQCNVETLYSSLVTVT
jgi:hypothetical protein